MSAWILVGMDKKLNLARGGCWSLWGKGAYARVRGREKSLARMQPQMIKEGRRSGKLPEKIHVALVAEEMCGS